jgi:hypothetical protein
MPKINPLTDMPRTNPIRTGELIPPRRKTPDPENPALDGNRDNALVRNHQRVDPVLFAGLGKGTSGTSRAIGVAPPGWSSSLLPRVWAADQLLKPFAAGAV